MTKKRGCGNVHLFDMDQTKAMFRARDAEAEMRELGVTARETGYVGDTISRDVLGARNANLGLVVRIQNPLIAHRDVAFQGADAPQADFVITELNELPAILRTLNNK